MNGNDITGFKRVHINTMVPLENAEAVRRAMGDAGAGVLGAYTHCSFTVRGEGRFKPTEDADPHIGEPGKLEMVEEVQVQVACDRDKAKAVIAALKQAHPYEEVPVEIFPLIEESDL